MKKIFSKINMLMLTLTILLISALQSALLAITPAISHLSGDPMDEDLKHLSDVTGQSARPSKASLRSQGFLMGDVLDDIGYNGQGDYSGDPDMYGEPDDDAYGDIVDSLSPFIAMSGDPGRRGSARTRPNFRKIAGYTGLGLGAAAATAGTAYGVKKIVDSIARRRSTNIDQSIRSNFRVVKPNHKFRFIDSNSLKLNSAPIDLTSTFLANDLALMMNKQQTDTPFFHDTVTGDIVGVNHNATAIGVTDPLYRYYSTVFVIVGINQLSFIPSQNIALTATLPTTSGACVIATEPIHMTFSKYGNGTIQLYPWTIVGNKPLLANGRYNASNPISVTLSGLPVAPGMAQMTLIVPGSQHKWTIMMRNAMLKGLTGL